MLNRISLATIVAVLVGLFAVSTATAAGPTDRDPIPPPTDYWQDKGFILMAHQGGEDVFPANTMFAYKQAIKLGADMLDMDAYVTEDKQIVLTHDLDPYKTSNAPGTGLPANDPVRIAAQINNQTVAELKQLDFAYKWSPKAEPGTLPFKGVATGDVPPPTGFTADDFKIPTFEEVLDAFPDTPINIELKQVAGVDIGETAAEMARLLALYPGHDESVIINSFGQEMLDAIHAARPQHKSFGGSQDATVNYLKGEPITPTPVALEPPDIFALKGIGDVRTVPVLKPGADHDGYQLFVWGSDKDPTQDTPAFFKKLIDEGADSYNTPNPIALAAYLCENGIADPEGNPRCEVDKTATVTRLSFARPKGQLKAGKKIRLTIKITSSPGMASKATVRLKSSNRQVKLPKVLTVPLKYSMKARTTTRTIMVKATRKARGKARIIAVSGRKKGTANLKIKRAKKAAKKAKRN